MKSTSPKPDASRTEVLCLGLVVFYPLLIIVGFVLGVANGVFEGVAPWLHQLLPSYFPAPPTISDLASFDSTISLEQDEEAPITSAETKPSLRKTLSISGRALRATMRAATSPLTAALSKTQQSAELKRSVSDDSDVTTDSSSTTTITATPKNTLNLEPTKTTESPRKSRPGMARIKSMASLKDIFQVGSTKSSASPSSPSTPSRDTNDASQEDDDSSSVSSNAGGDSGAPSVRSILTPKFLRDPFTDAPFNNKDDAGGSPQSNALGRVDSLSCASPSKRPSVLQRKKSSKTASFLRRNPLRSSSQSRRFDSDSSTTENDEARRPIFDLRIIPPTPVLGGAASNSKHPGTRRSLLVSAGRRTTLARIPQGSEKDRKRAVLEDHARKVMELESLLFSDVPTQSIFD